EAARPAAEPAPGAPAARLLLLSARTEGALDRATRRLAEHLRRHPRLDLADVAWTLHAGRRVFSHRRALVCASVAEAADLLTVLDPAKVADAFDAGAPRRRDIALLLPGEWNAAAGTGRGLYQ